MYYVGSIDHASNIADPRRKREWVKLMSAKERDWVQLYQKFPTELNEYIHSVCYDSLDDEDCQVELQLLRMHFDWEEDYSINWEFNISAPSVEVKYPSFEEMLEAWKSDTKPGKSAYAFWDSKGRDLEVSWGWNSPPRLSIISLKLK